MHRRSAAEEQQWWRSSRTPEIQAVVVDTSRCIRKYAFSSEMQRCVKVLYNMMLLTLVCALKRTRGHLKSTPS